MHCWVGCEQAQLQPVLHGGAHWSRPAISLFCWGSGPTSKDFQIMADRSADSFQTRSELSVGNSKFTYFSLPKFAAKTGKDISKLPYSLRILLENLLRCEDGIAVSPSDVEALANWDARREPDTEIAFHPARVVLQDFTGVPCVVDLAAMRDAMADMGGDPAKINPLFPAELVIDHSVQVDNYGSADALVRNTEQEYERNQERYAFLR